jgi:hypothetical protein
MNMANNIAMYRNQENRVATFGAHQHHICSFETLLNAQWRGGRATKGLVFSDAPLVYLNST